MSFSSDLKQEISKTNNLAKKQLVQAEFFGYLLTINTVLNKDKIRFSTENEYNINRFNKLLSNLDIDYTIQIQGKVYSIEFSKLDIPKSLKNEFSIDEQKSVIRGVFLGSGSINNPSRNYHIEMILQDEEKAKYIQNILKEHQISTKILKRKKGYSVYSKDGEEISKIIALMGANKSVLKYEEIRVVNQTRNNVNRIVNCETANINKTINASLKQIQAIKELKKNKKFDNLPESLKEIANLRLENPEASLIELGQMLTKPIGKSGVNHRLKKLEEIARRKVKKVKEIGIYVHIPFCKKKCYYCDFVSYSDKMDYAKEYVDCLKKEIGYNKKEILVKTIYIGGGTPSYIFPKYIKEILDKIRQCFKVKKDVEITIEVNPGTVDKEKLKSYLEVGVNRISIGMQACENKILEKIGRIHTFEKFIDTYELARKVGFKNINIDVMIGLLEQNINSIEKTVNQLKILNPEHVSIYSLILEEGTILEKKVSNKEESLPKEELERKMYWFIKQELEKLGYIHYEISNFAKVGYESKHNLDCWGQKEYIGFGVAAHSYINKIRYSNIEHIEKYIENIQDNKIEENIQIHEEQTKEDEKKEFVLLGLRKIQGISIKEFENRFGENIVNKYGKIFEKLINKKLLQIEGEYIKLTNKGIDLANLVWQEFV